MTAADSTIQTIGIPRTLFYFKHPGLWETFFTCLGFSVVLSGKTTATILETGARIADSESCVSCKIFSGHCAELISKSVDALLIPRCLSIRKGFVSCPRLYALNDTVAHEFEPAPRIISPCVDANNRSLYSSLFATGLSLTKNAVRIHRAIAAAKRALRAHAETGFEHYHSLSSSSNPRILLVGHPYVLHDRFANHDISVTLSSLGTVVVPVDEVPINHSNGCHTSGWDFMDDILCRTASAYADGFHGVLQLSTFNCGCDSVMKVLLERQCRDFTIPYMPLVLDEHTSDAAIQTRVEAFIDSAF